MTCCPVCGEKGGFHLEAAHSEARSRIPRELIKEKGWHERKD